MPDTDPPVLSLGTLIRAFVRAVFLLLILGMFAGLALVRDRFNPPDAPLLAHRHVDRLGFPPEPPGGAVIPDGPEDPEDDPQTHDEPGTTSASTEPTVDPGHGEETATAHGAGEESSDPQSGDEPDRERIDWANTPITGPVPDVQVAVFLSRRTMGLVHGGAYIRAYHHLAHARDVSAPKLHADDHRTPQGSYRILAHQLDGAVMTLVLNYPNAADARRGLEAGLIDRATHDRIVEADRAGRAPPWDTPLGGPVRITGDREQRGVTEGDLSIRKADMEELWLAVHKGTPVRILP